MSILWGCFAPLKIFSTELGDCYNWDSLWSQNAIEMMNLDKFIVGSKHACYNDHYSFR